MKRILGFVFLGVSTELAGEEAGGGVAPGIGGAPAGDAGLTGPADGTGGGPGNGNPELGPELSEGEGEGVREGAGVSPGFVFEGDKEGTDGETGGITLGPDEEEDGVIGPPGGDAMVGVDTGEGVGTGLFVGDTGIPGAEFSFLAKGDLVTLNLGGVPPVGGRGGTPFGVSLRPVDPGVGGGGGGGGGEAGIFLTTRNDV